MRQAGRYLPEYRALRADAGDFLTLCFTPDLAAEATLQPIRRYGFDAAILFSDILVVNWALGQSLRFVEGEGPRLSPVTDRAGFDSLGRAPLRARLAPVYDAIRQIKRRLGPETPLIGFSGAPWTLATYAIAGQGSADQGAAKSLLSADPDLFYDILSLLEAAATDHLAAQIEAGVDAVMVFDSWAGAAPADSVAQICLEPCRRIRAALAQAAPGAPVILFPRGVAPEVYEAFDAVSGADALGLGQMVDIDWARRALTRTPALQGAIDPKLLLGPRAELEQALDRTRATFEGRAHILNLGHGVTPDVDPETVAALVAHWRGGAHS